MNPGLRDGARRPGAPLSITLPARDRGYAVIELAREKLGTSSVEVDVEGMLDTEEPFELVVRGSPRGGAVSAEEARRRLHDG